MASFPPQWEKAEVSIEGNTFSAWESIRVRSDFEEPPPFFTLTTAESVPGAQSQSALQIKPGDRCSIKLAGKQALLGYVNTRQASYDATRHGVMVQGRSKTQDAVDCKIEIEKLNGGGNWKDKTLQQIADEVLKQVDTKLKIMNGGGKPFEDVQVMIGESFYNLIERLAKIQGLFLFHDENGGLVASKDPFGTMGSLIEGKNIKSCRATLQDQSLMSVTTVVAQQSGTKEHWGYDASQVKHQVQNELGLVKRNRPMLIHCEKPSTKEETKSRCEFDDKWSSTVYYDVEVVVYGWLTGGKSGSLWAPGFWTHLQSPMAMITDKLWIRSVTFTQDNQSGTLTTIDLRRDPTNKSTSVTQKSSPTSGRAPGPGEGL